MKNIIFKHNKMICMHVNLYSDDTSKKLIIYKFILNNKLVYIINKNYTNNNLPGLFFTCNDNKALCNIIKQFYLEFRTEFDLEIILCKDDNHFLCPNFDDSDFDITYINGFDETILSRIFGHLIDNTKEIFNIIEMYISIFDSLDYSITDANTKNLLLQYTNNTINNVLPREIVDYILELSLTY